MSAAAAIHAATSQANGVGQPQQPAAPTWSGSHAPAIPPAPKKRTLWNIQDDMLALEELLDETGGDISDPRCEAAFDQFAAELASDFNRKADGYAGFIAEQTALAEVRKTESDRLLKRSKISKNLADALKTRLKIAMDTLGKTKHETTRYKLSVCNPGGIKPIHIMDTFEKNPETLPEKYRRKVESFVIDKDAIRADLEAAATKEGTLITNNAAGEEVAFATWKTRETYLRIS